MSTEIKILQTIQATVLHSISLKYSVKLTQIRHHDPQSKKTFVASGGRDISSHQKALAM